jgi:hypothetical protein
MPVWPDEMPDVEVEGRLRMSLTKSKLRCSADVHNSFGVSFHQCNRNVWKDGFCKQHHPDTVAVRDTARRTKWDTGDKKEQAAYRVVRAERAVLKTAEEFYDADSIPQERLGVLHIIKLRSAVEKLRELRKELAKL